MIEWYQNLYLDNVTASETELYKSLVMDGRVHIPPVYCVCMASNKENLLDVISCNEMIYGHYKRASIKVIGLAASYKASLDIVRKIIMDVYNETGGCDVREFFE